MQQDNALASLQKQQERKLTQHNLVIAETF